MARHLSAKAEAFLRRKASCNYDDLSQQEQESKLIAELSSTIEELQTATVKLLEKMRDW